MSLAFKMLTQAFMGHKNCKKFKLKQRLTRIIWQKAKTIVLRNAIDTKRGGSIEETKMNFFYTQ
jgi:hypothetical protein